MNTLDYFKPMDALFLAKKLRNPQEGVSSDVLATTLEVQHQQIRKLIIALETYSLFPDQRANADALIKQTKEYLK